MLVRLTRAGRLKAGRSLASIYMLCVLMPALSLAFADGVLGAPCFTDPEHAMGIVHVYETAVGSAQHVHHEGHDHGDHAKVGHHGDMQGSGKQSADNGPQSPAGGRKASGAQCCSMVCVSALPVSMTEFVAPSAPPFRCVSETYWSVAGRTPPTLYRPPIS